MECPMCWELYNSTRVARNLLCGHTYCSPCLESIYNVSKRIECPLCRTKHEPHIKPHLLSKNYVAMDLASKHFEVQKKFELCASHPKLPLQFFCEDDQTNMCTECIAEHYGHKFFKYEHSGKIQSKLKQQSELLEKQIKGFDNCKEQLELENQKTIQLLDDQFDKLIKKIEQRKQEMKEQQLKIFTSECEQIDQELAFNQSLLTNMNSIATKLEQKNNELKVMKALKSNDIIKEIDDLEEDVDRDVTQLKQLKSSEIKKMPKLVFDQKIFKDINTFGQFKKELQNPQICFFGDKHKILIYNIQNNEWSYKQMPIVQKSLKNQNTLEYNYYAAAVSLPSGDIIITGGGMSRNTMLISPSKGFSSQALKSMYFPRKEHACVYLDGFVYAIGGYVKFQSSYDGSQKQMLSCCERYSLASDEWKMIDPLQKQKCAFAAAAAINKFIYVFGGFDGRDRLNTIERYSVKENQWKVLDVKFKQGFSNAAAISYDDNKILILGGGSNQGFSYDLQLFDVNEQILKTLSKMNEGRDLRNKLVIFNNNLYACGNYSIERYSLSQNLWVPLKSYDYLIQDNLDSWCSALTFEVNSLYSVSNLLKHNQQKQQQYQKYKYDEQVSFENDSFNQDALSEEFDDFGEYQYNGQQSSFNM